MKITSTFLLFSLFMQQQLLLATPHFYNKNILAPGTIDEIRIVNHTITSLEKALNKVSKLSNSAFSTDKTCNSKHGVIPYYHLVNNLCSLQNTTHLHIGLYTGGSFVSALYGNENAIELAVGIDWYTDDSEWGHKNVCYQACKKYLQQNIYTILEANCFTVSPAILKKPINIYVYDADHSLDAHTKAFTYYNGVFANVFIAIVDDWNLEDVREGTFQAFDQLEYHILYENEIPNGEKIGNGQYIAVIKK